jgi:hypothetical protein
MEIYVVTHGSYFSSLLGDSNDGYLPAMFDLSEWLQDSIGLYFDLITIIEDYGFVELLPLIGKLSKSELIKKINDDYDMIVFEQQVFTQSDVFGGLAPTETSIVKML